MKLELPDNNASVLFHMGNALQSIARDIDTSLPVNGHKITHTEAVGDVSHSVTVEPLVKLSESTDLIDTDSNGDDMTKDIAAEHDRLLGVSDTIDAEGLPWDQRINSKGRTRIKGDVWRARQKPNDKTDEEWAEYVEGVKTELRALMAIPVAVTYDPNEADPFAIDAVDVSGVEFKRLPGVIREVEIHGTIVTPPVVDAVVTPPVVDAVVTPPVVEVGPFYWEHPESDSYGVVQTREELESYLESDPCCVEITKEMYDKLLSESKDVVIPPPLVTPPVVDAVVTPPVVDAVDVTLMVRPTFEEAVETRGESVKAYVDAVDGLINKINATPPVVTPPPVTTGPTTFPELMKFITVNNKKLTKESVDEALKAQGLASIALLAARTDLIPQVHAALVKLL